MLARDCCWTGKASEISVSYSPWLRYLSLTGQYWCHRRISQRMHQLCIRSQFRSTFLQFSMRLQFLVDACLALFFGPGEDCEDEFLLFWDRFGRCFGSAAHYDHLVSDSLGVGLFGSRVYCLALRLWNSMDCTSRFECCTLRVYNGCCRARWGPMWGQQPVDVLPC